MGEGAVKHRDPHDPVLAPSDAGVAAPSSGAAHLRKVSVQRATAPESPAARAAADIPPTSQAGALGHADVSRGCLGPVPRNHRAIARQVTGGPPWDPRQARVVGCGVRRPYAAELRPDDGDQSGRPLPRVEDRAVPVGSLPALTPVVDEPPPPLPGPPSSKVPIRVIPSAS